MSRPNLFPRKPEHARNHDTSKDQRRSADKASPDQAAKKKTVIQLVRQARNPVQSKRPTRLGNSPALLKAKQIIATIKDKVQKEQVEGTSRELLQKASPELFEAYTTIIKNVKAMSSNSGRRDLMALARFTSHCHMACFSGDDPANITRAFEQAIALATRSRLPTQLKESEGHRLIREAIDPAIDQTVKQLASVHRFTQALVAAGLGADRLRTATLSDMVALWRSGRSAQQIVNCADTISVQAEAARQQDSSVPTELAPPIWAQTQSNESLEFQQFTHRNAQQLHDARPEDPLRKACAELGGYYRNLATFDSGDTAEHFRAIAQVAHDGLVAIEKTLDENSAEQADLLKLIRNEKKFWDLTTHTMRVVEHRYPDADRNKISVRDLIVIGHTKLAREKGTDYEARRGGLEATEMAELIAARSSFAPDLPIEHFLAMKDRYLPVTAGSIPDTAMSKALAEVRLTELGSGEMGTVYKVEIPGKHGQTSSWVLKEESPRLETCDGGTDSGIYKYLDDFPAGPNLTNRTVAASRVARRFGSDIAPESVPVVFRNPVDGKLVYGAASRFVEGSTLQSAKGKSATYTPDPSVQQALTQLPPQERDQLVTRVATALGFASASRDADSGRWTLKPVTDGMYMNRLNWDDPELRRSGARQALWAVKTAQVDNHPGNYMVVKSRNGTGHTLNSFDNDQSMGRLVTHPMAAAAVSDTQSRDAWTLYLNSPSDTAVQPATIDRHVLAELLATDKERFIKANRRLQKANPTLEETAEAAAKLAARRERIERTYQDLAAAADGKPSTLQITDHGQWTRRTNMHGGPTGKASGIPKVIAKSDAHVIASMTEADVNADLNGLDPEERASDWKRVQVLQTMISKGDIRSIDDSLDAWTGDAVRDQMGLNPTELQAIARADLQDDVQGTPNGDKHRLKYGVTATLALEQAMAEEAFRMRMAGQPVGAKPLALFDPDLLNRTLLDEARKLQAGTPARA